jgi:hypothetical protein
LSKDKMDPKFKKTLKGEFIKLAKKLGVEMDE